MADQLPTQIRVKPRAGYGCIVASKERREGAATSAGLRVVPWVGGCGAEETGPGEAQSAALAPACLPPALFGPFQPPLGGGSPPQLAGLPAYPSGLASSCTQSPNHGDSPETIRNQACARVLVEDET